MKKGFPTPSLPESITTFNNEFLVIVEFDLDSYRKKMNSKAVKETLSIPGWLNEEATAKGINFSQVIQEALITKIQSM